MKTDERKDGLSARRRAIDMVKKNLSRVNPFLKYILGLGLIVLIATLFFAYQKQWKTPNSIEGKDKTVVVSDSLDKPKVNIQVNRHFDEKGNMVGFDSTYSTFYSNVKGDTARMDSLMHSFDNYFKKDGHSLLDSEFNTLFFNDSLRYPDFFHKDFFLKRYELNDTYFRDMMKKMDSIKNHFYQSQSKPKEGKKSRS
jgi:hypothetical protein